jgi:catechol 2,3-dioxygenase-like lactoylglutathione lyase family enzyme
MATALDIAYVRYVVPDLDRMERFLDDFGLVPATRTARSLHMRGYAPGIPCHLSDLPGEGARAGIGLIAHSRRDLDELAERFGTNISVDHELCSGSMVTLTDPSGFRVDVLHGVEIQSGIATRDQVSLNNVHTRARMGRGVRLSGGRSHAMRLGHVVLKVTDMRASLRFYEDLLGFRIADSYYAEEPGNTVVAFLRCGLGDQYTDHHTLAFAASPAAGIEHSAFEVLDLDDLALGNDHLRACGYRHSWGIGRHIEGSQIFDYWRDPFGNKIEHWTDGDLINDDYPASHQPLNPKGLAQWGPPLNPEFFE